MDSKMIILKTEEEIEFMRAAEQACGDDARRSVSPYQAWRDYVAAR